MLHVCVNNFVMEIKEETHLILPSDQTHYPNNTASKFKVKLPHTIRLASGVDWYASCDNFIIPREVKPDVEKARVCYYKRIPTSTTKQTVVCASDTVEYNKQKSTTEGIVAKLRQLLNQFKIEGVEDVKLNSDLEFVYSYQNLHLMLGLINSVT